MKDTETKKKYKRICQRCGIEFYASWYNVKFCPDCKPITVAQNNARARMKKLQNPHEIDPLQIFGVKVCKKCGKKYPSYWRADLCPECDGKRIDSYGYDYGKKKAEEYLKTLPPIV